MPYVPAAIAAAGERVGMSRTTGKLLTGFAHCVQSILDIITTAIGTRVMRLEYGADAFGLIDAPGTKYVLALWYSRVATAVYNFEPGFRITRFFLEDTDKGGGHYIIALGGTYYPRGHLGDYSVSEDATMRFILSSQLGELVITGAAA